jgi:hypothetical protein
VVNAGSKKTIIAYHRFGGRCMRIALAALGKSHRKVPPSLIEGHHL